MRVRSTRDFGAVARDRRRELAMSQADVAATSGVTRQWVVRFEQGADNVSLAKMLMVFRTLDLDIFAETPKNDAAETPGAWSRRISNRRG